MTQTTATEVGSTSAGVVPGTSYVEWGAVLAGAFFAAALSYVFLTFGAAVGLSATTPWDGSGMSAKTMGSLAVFYVMVQQIGAFMAGAYLAGRMRARWHVTTDDEVEFRDGVHGGLVWAVGVLIGAALLIATATTTASVGANLAGRTVGAMASATDPMDVVIDTMLRPAAPAPAQGQAEGATPGSAPAAAPQASPPATGQSQENARAEMRRVLMSSVASGSMTDQNRTYLARLISQRTGLPQAEAENRVNAALASARQAAETARNAAVLTGFVTAAALIVSLGAAWWSAIKGGNHRDNSVPARFEFGAHGRLGAPFNRRK